jgi:hypothetical protein
MEKESGKKNTTKSINYAQIAKKKWPTKPQRNLESL